MYPLGGPSFNLLYPGRLPECSKTVDLNLDGITQVKGQRKFQKEGKRVPACAKVLLEEILWSFMGTVILLECSWCVWGGGAHCGVRKREQFWAREALRPGPALGMTW